MEGAKMSEREIRLLKMDEMQNMDVDQGEPVAVESEEQSGQNHVDVTHPAVAVEMTPAEAEEAARFRRMAADKAARQVMLEQLMAELAEFDELSSAA
jgi:hypothetical protein